MCQAHEKNAMRYVSTVFTDRVGGRMAQMIKGRMRVIGWAIEPTVGCGHTHARTNGIDWKTYGRAAAVGTAWAC